MAEKNLSYKIPSLFFNKFWFWFADPTDVAGADLANFFSYNLVDSSGFIRRDRLTTVIDLSSDLSEIWSRTRKNFIQKQIARGERNGITVKEDKNFFEFNKIYKLFRQDKKLAEDNQVIFKNGLLFSAYHKNRMIAGGVFLTDGRQMRALVLASLRLHSLAGPEREIIGQANRMVIWQAIKYAKETGHQIFDLGGIDPDSPDQTQRSLTEFKEAFGGQRRPCYYYYKIYSPVLKFLIRARDLI